MSYLLQDVEIMYQTLDSGYQTTAFTFEPLAFETLEDILCSKPQASQLDVSIICWDISIIVWTVAHGRRTFILFTWYLNIENKK